MSYEKEYDGKGPAVADTADAALGFLNAREATVMTPEDEKRLLRKIDWRIVPLMCKSAVKMGGSTTLTTFQSHATSYNI